MCWECLLGIRDGLHGATVEDRDDLVVVQLDVRVLLGHLPGSIDDPFHPFEILVGLDVDCELLFGFDGRLLGGALVHAAGPFLHVALSPASLAWRSLEVSCEYWFLILMALTGFAICRVGPRA